ncbi:hypothetical protein GF327_07515 [Candidatus Woesearchaeota archaeon]|nr:hypothetical protein [Candidatus Woesearchaeota archaeon]MBD3283352.1 hypothetical protein [Candidatus Pacearchaeota archaeon]
MRTDVKLMKHTIRSEGEVDHFVYRVTIPKALIEELSWKKGDKLKPSILMEKGLLLEKKE